jgi:hypothetical protein
VSNSDPTSIPGKRIHHHLLSTKYTPLFIVAKKGKKERRKRKEKKRKERKEKKRKEKKRKEKKGKEKKRKKIRGFYDSEDSYCGFLGY